MEESARKLEELKTRRKLDSTSMAKSSMDDISRRGVEGETTPLGDRNSVQYRSLDTDTMTGRDKQRGVIPVRDNSMSMSTGHLVDREQRLRMDEQGLILPLDDGSMEDIKQKQERRSRRDLEDRRLAAKTAVDEYAQREISPGARSYSAFQQTNADIRSTYSIRARARSVSPSSHSMYTESSEPRSLSSASRRDMSPPTSISTIAAARDSPYSRVIREMSPPTRDLPDGRRREISPPTRDTQQLLHNTLPRSGRELQQMADYAQTSRQQEVIEMGRITNQPGLDPGEYYPIIRQDSRRGRVPTTGGYPQDDQLDRSRVSPIGTERPTERPSRQEQRQSVFDGDLNQSRVSYHV